MKKIVLAQKGIESLFGANDQNIKFLESVLNVEVNTRGSDLIVHGEEEDVETVERILDDYAALVREGRQPSDRDLKLVLRQIAEDKSYSLREHFRIGTINPAGKKIVTARSANQLRYLQAIERKDLVFSIGPAGTGKCVAGSTLVLTEQGLIPIASLGARTSPGTYSPIDVRVAGLHGTEQASHLYNGGHSRAKRIRTRLGFEIEVTPEHPLLRLDNDGHMRWRAAAELRVGDYVAIQRGQRLWGQQTAVEFDYRRNGSRDHAKPIMINQLDEDFAYFLGILTGDGCLAFKNRVILSNTEPEILKHFQSIAHRLGLHIFSNGGNRSYDRIIASSQLYQLLLHLGMSDGRAATKQVPWAILRAPEPLVIAFLQGLFDTDGTVNRRDGYPQLSSVSKQLIDEAQLLLLNLGILANKRQKWTRYRDERRLSYQLDITGSDADRFYQEVGFRLPRKQALGRKRSRNTNVDVTPQIHEVIHSAISSGTFSHDIHQVLGDYKTGRRKPSYEVLRKVVGWLEEGAPNTAASTALSELQAQHFFWAEIMEIKDGEADVYDLTVPGSHTFCANGFVNHNTYLAVAMAVQLMMNKRVNRIILTRPAIEAGEKLGFLPGDLQEKVDPYLRPLYDALYDIMEYERVERLLERRAIEIAPLAFMRGRTLAESFIILDEGQNATSEQMKMFLTRIGLDSKVVVTGDVTQIDLPAGKRSGLVEAQQIFSGIEGVEFVYFTEKDVVRHPLVKSIIKAYEDRSKKETVD